MAAVSNPLPLLPHPDSPAIALQVSASATLEARELVLHYRVSGDTAAVRWPEPAGGGAADGLWHHTCFEAFLAGPEPGAYREFNFSPSGRWADYSFQRPRERDPRAQAPHAPLIERRESADGVELVAVLDRRRLPAAPWRLGLTAVIEDRQGRVSHWALHHPRPVPDFHDPAGWTLRLPAH
jgi:hypothetical protein